MDRARRHSHGFLSAFLLIVLSLPAHALAPPVTPIGLRHIQKAGGVLNGRVTYQIGLGQAATYVEKNIAIGKISMGSVAKGILGRGLAGGAAYLALTALLEGAGYLWDEAAEEVKSQGDPGGYPCENGRWGNNEFSSAHTPWACDEASAFALWKEYLPTAYSGWFNWEITSIVLTSGDPYDDVASTRGYVEVCYLKNGGSGPSECTEDQFIGVYDSSGSATQPAIPGETISNETLGELVIEHGDPGLWEDMLIDPVTGQPITVQEIADGMWDLQKEKVEQAGGDPETVPAPATVGDAEEGTSEEAPESDLPKFCTWATIVCDWADWQQETPEEPEAPELPLVDVPIPSDWDSGLGTSACPAASTVTIWNDTVVEIPWQPACDGADILRPILLAMAYFIAAGILVGRRT